MVSGVRSGSSILSLRASNKGFTSSSDVDLVNCQDITTPSSLSTIKIVSYKVTHLPSDLKYPILDATLKVWSSRRHLRTLKLAICDKYARSHFLKTIMKHLAIISLVGYGLMIRLRLSDSVNEVISSFVNSLFK